MEYILKIQMKSAVKFQLPSEPQQKLHYHNVPVRMVRYFQNAVQYKAATRNFHIY